MRTLKDDCEMLWETDSKVCIGMTSPDSGEYIRLIYTK